MSEKLAAKLTASGISRVVFIRHANAAPPGSKAKGEYGTIHDWQRDDQVERMRHNKEYWSEFLVSAFHLQLRPLTEKGKSQAVVAREWFSKEIGVSTNKVCHMKIPKQIKWTKWIAGFDHKRSKKVHNTKVLILPSPKAIFCKLLYLLLAGRASETLQLMAEQKVGPLITTNRFRATQTRPSTLLVL